MSNSEDAQNIIRKKYDDTAKFITVSIELDGRLKQIMEAVLISSEFKGFSEEAILKLTFKEWLSHEAVKREIFKVLKDNNYTDDEIRMLFQDIGSKVATGVVLKKLNDMNHLTHRKLKMHGKAESSKIEEVSDKKRKR